MTEIPPSSGSGLPENPLAIPHGGTGSTTKNFVDLTTNQSVSGTKTMSLGASTATTQQVFDNSTKIATTAFVNANVQLTMGTLPLSVTGGVVSFASNGTGVNVVVFCTGGVIESIPSIINAGTGYKVGDVFIPLGGNEDAIIRVTTVSGTTITGVQVLYGGTGYTTGAEYATITLWSVPPFTITLSGTLTSNLTLVMTNWTYLTQSNQWCIANNTTGAYTTTVKVSNSSDTPIWTGVVLPQGTNNSTSCFIQTDGVTDVWFGNGYIGDNVTVGSISGGVQNRVTTPTIASSYTVNSDTTDVYLIIGQNEACSIDISAPSNWGVYYGREVLIKIQDDGTSRALTWNSSDIKAGDAISLPTATTAGKTTPLLFWWDDDDLYWYLVGAPWNF